MGDSQWLAPNRPHFHLISSVGVVVVVGRSSEGEEHAHNRPNLTPPYIIKGGWRGGE